MCRLVCSRSGVNGRLSLVQYYLRKGWAGCQLEVVLHSVLWGIAGTTGGWSSSRNYYGNIWVYSGMYVSTDSSSSSSSRGSRRRGVQQRWIVKKVKNQETQQRQAKHASKDRSNQDR